MKVRNEQYEETMALSHNLTETADTSEPEGTDSMLSFLGDICMSKDQYENAREYYKQLSFNTGNIEKYFRTFLVEMDIEGLLAARDLILAELTLPQEINVLHGVVKTLFSEVAANEGLMEEHLQRYQNNLEYLKKIDSSCLDRFRSYYDSSGKTFIEKEITRILKIKGIIYFAIDDVWQKIEKPANEKEQLEAHLGKSKNLIVRCTSLSIFENLLTQLQTEKPEFVKYLIYVLVDFNHLPAYLTVLDLRSLINCDYVFRFIDEADMEAHITEVVFDRYTLFPYTFVPLNETDNIIFDSYVIPIFKKMIKRINERIEHYNDELNSYYHPDFPASIPQKIEKKTLKILFRTSRYSTYVQYCTCDLADGFRQLGFKVEIEIEGENYSYGLREDACLKLLSDFKPDIIICIDYLRYENTWIPQNIPFVSWLQEALPHVYSGRFLSNINKNDIILNEIYHKDMIKAGYKDVIPFPVHVNVNSFHGSPESVKYKYDITHVCHLPAKYPFSEMCLSRLTDTEQYEKFNLLNEKLYKLIFTNVPEPFNTSMHQYTTIEDFESLTKDLIEAERLYLEISEDIYYQIATTTPSYIAKMLVFKWIVDSGYSLSLFGKGWEKTEEFSSAARGVVNYGCDLSVVYNKTKINLSVAYNFTAQHRVFEVIASGGFLMIGYVDPAKDFHSIEKFLKEGEGYIFFKGKNDLISKIDYYLNNEEERIEIINKGMRKVLESYTVKSGAQTILKLLSNRFKG